MSFNSDRIRITYLIDRLRYFAGTEKHLFQLVSLINRDKFSINIITFDCYDEIRRSFEEVGVKIDVININKLLTFNTFYHLKKLRDFIKKCKPDIVQTFHFTSDTLGVIAAKLAGVPVVVSSRRDMGDLKKKSQIYINKLINPFIDKFISVCNKVKDGVSRLEGIPLSRIQTIYNGVDLNRYDFGDTAKEKAREKIGIKKDAFVVGIVCLFRPEKDVRLFFKAMSKIKKSIDNLAVLAVGTGPTINDLKIYCDNNSLTERTIFTGYINDVRDYVLSMDVVCLTPKENEGLSNALLEEMAMGKPVIATDVGGNAELIDQGVNGFIISPGDVESLADRITILYKNDTLRESMSLASRKRVEQYFSTDIMIQNIERFYKELVIEKSNFYDPQNNK